MQGAEDDGKSRSRLEQRGQVAFLPDEWMVGVKEKLPAEIYRMKGGNPRDTEK